MRGTVFNFLLIIAWPSLQALFTVETEQESYDAELHGSVRLGCRFSPVQSVSHLSVTWLRVSPGPSVEVYRLEKGNEKLNFTSKQFRLRAQLVKKELESYRAVLEISNLRISDSGEYQCIISHDEADYKQTKLHVRATYIPVKKSIRSIGQDKVELTCESQGFPLASVVWNLSTATTSHLADRTNSSNEKTSDGIFKVTSHLIVRSSAVKNYTCSFISEGRVSQSATFSIPDDIPGTARWSRGYVAFGVIAVMCVGFSMACLILYRRKKGILSKAASSTECRTPDQHLTVTSTDSLLPSSSQDLRTDNIVFSSEGYKDQLQELREVLKQRYSELRTPSEKESAFAQQMQNGESHYLEVNSILPDMRETVILHGQRGSGKSFLSQKLAASWADSLHFSHSNIQRLKLVILIDFKGVTGDLFHVVQSKIPSEAGLETAYLREILLGTVDSLLILDGYKEGDREVDESLMKFLTERTTCRVLITACPGEYGILQETVSQVVRL